MIQWIKCKYDYCSRGVPRGGSSSPPPRMSRKEGHGLAAPPDLLCVALSLGAVVRDYSGFNLAGSTPVLSQPPRPLPHLSVDPGRTAALTISPLVVVSSIRYLSPPSGHGDHGGEGPTPCARSALPAAVPQLALFSPFTRSGRPWALGRPCDVLSKNLPRSLSVPPCLYGTSHSASGESPVRGFKKT